MLLVCEDDVARCVGDVARVTLASDAVAARAICRDDPPSVVVLDAALLGWTAIELLRHLRMTTRAPILFVGNDDASLVVGAINGGVRHVLRRPLDAADVRNRVKAALKG